MQTENQKFVHINIFARYPHTRKAYIFLHLIFFTSFLFYIFSFLHPIFLHPIFYIDMYISLVYTQKSSVWLLRLYDIY